MKKTLYISILILIISFGFFDMVQAIEYTLLEPLPGLSVVKTGGFGDYLSLMYRLAISLATVLAVVLLSIAGVKYMTEETFTGKSDAKKNIQNAIYGLLLILSAYLILQTINPDLVETEFVIPPVSSGTEDVSVDASEYIPPSAGSDTQITIDGQEVTLLGSDNEEYESKTYSIKIENGSCPNVGSGLKNCSYDNRSSICRYKSDCN